MLRHTAVLCFILSAAIVGSAQEVQLPLPNESFENGLEGWEVHGDPPMGSISEEKAHSGQYSLKIDDRSDERGSNVRSVALPIDGPAVLEIRGWYFPESGHGLGVYHAFRDADGTDLTAEPHLRGLGGSSRQWQEFALRAYAPDEAVSIDLWLHSYNASKVTGYFDDLQIVSIGMDAMAPPWEGTYKIDPEQNPEALTPADVVGPDGIVYPDWSRAGVQGGIPDVPAVVDIEDFGGAPDDDADDSEALAAACRAAGQQGGGAVTIGDGTWHLDRPVSIHHDGVVIRGAGPERTRIFFRYNLGEDGIRFYSPESGGRVGPNTEIELHASPTDLEEIRITMDDVLLRHWTRGTHSGNTFNCSARPAKAFEELEDGPHTLIGTASYSDGSETRREIPVILDSDWEAPADLPSSKVAIGFHGDGYTGPRRELAVDAKRGDMEVTLQDAGDLQAEDVVLIVAPATERWNDLVRNACRWGAYRENMYQIQSVEGNTLHFDQPLRLGFPVVDGSYVQKIDVIEGCGLEDLYIEQTENLWISTSTFRFALNCWARNVTVHMCGQFPIYAGMSKFCEIRDCVFDDAWFKGGGGTAYAGWDHCFDCLMDGTDTYRLRHAPGFHWAASGNVIRNGLFEGSDGQWHSGWTNENLFESCTIRSYRGHGSYGYGMWGSPPEDTAHGPQGPRNVIYNCDVTSERDALWMGGMNENWLMLYNRCVVESGRGVFAKDASFDHIIRGNVFVLQDQKSPMVVLQTPDCIGVEIIDNALYGGNGKFVEGMADPEVLTGNKAYSLPAGADLPARPTPPVESIYQWQVENCP